MARYNAPVPYTCPMIDKVISAIESIEWDDTQWPKNDLIDTMEKIRESNDSLRNWGNEKYDDCEELGTQIESLEKDINYLNIEIGDLSNEIKDLNNEILKLKDELIQA